MKFKPLLKETLWGGSRILKFKDLDLNYSQVGESWEISGLKGNESIVASGQYEGWKLPDVLHELKDRLVGTENYKQFGDEFPLLIKFIDAAKDLSVQVHPNDKWAQKYGYKNGKTEMWYVMDSAPDASLLCGLKEQITPDEYKKMVADGTICDAIARFKVKDGDCFFIPAGRIHSIGSGCFLAEIQQSSDITYRIYDFNRRDKNGNLRELHTEKAAECINFAVEDECQTDYVPVKNQGVSLVRCSKFNTSVYDLDEPMTIDYSELDSFVIFICTNGEGLFEDNEGNKVQLKAGESMLVPATTKSFHVSGKVKFLETYI